jgi:YrbI family 3-deoxy-D-manno-octulosonate 8-phosphate phosphatase|tara:strand:- start:2031 stop:2507 length:477 start_codon:yes stop_codon:yes gene_type:complete
MDLRNIQLIAYDFDGVMTDNSVYLDEKGNEMVKVSRSDGLAISLIKNIGIDQIILSSENNPVVKKRAEKLSIECFYGVENKAETFKKYIETKNIKLNNVAFVGNDINDLEVMKIVALSIAPNDAQKVVKDIAHYITKSMGGKGVIREIYDLIIMTKKG